MHWLMVYVTIALATLSVAGAWCCSKSHRRDSRRLVAIVAAAALWPVVALGLVQLGAIALYAKHLRRRVAAPAEPLGATDAETRQMRDADLGLDLGELPLVS